MSINYKYYFDKAFICKANIWWRTLSINEQKAFEKKYKTIMGQALQSEIAEIYDNENHSVKADG